MSVRDLPHGLQRLGRTIGETCGHMKHEVHPFRDEMHLAAKELKERCHISQYGLRCEAADAETHGRHVGDLEKSVHRCPPVSVKISC